ncbi:tRNA synthetases class I-domain-containing protein [Neohortaea acidophila]|uniref:Valine--tRNA ligase, mitochondrial n=1 Tax=Neohortaea acidophila TaxID=245834 RepID=A0A6A6PQ86_9PEZI|nr:tRNA synthetases class I-domain-containing protein [Neohortaea acidophila]KAF2482268.1 tRNA synthetases class I-domain-containing protein [Neohortaea acidophila]
MALNAASHNATGERTGPQSGQPPPPSNETKDAVLQAANGDLKGQNAPGQDGGDKSAEKKVKSEKELAKERQKAEKAAKLAAKIEKQKALEAASKPKQKEKKTQEKLPPYVEQTPKGEKKILQPLDDEYHKAYIPSVVESAWMDWWEAQGFHLPEFKENGEVKDKGSFVISIPPPNVTGNLHIGHALATALQDAMIRWNRMKGLTVLYVPGCDHAGISTQSVVENMLYNRRNGMTRHDLGRPKFVETVWEWKEEYHTRINKVLRRLGGSMDWTREGFTMSPTLSKAVRQTFVQLHDDGLIYRANRLVNWCTKLNTALSNLEVDQKELEGSTKIDVPGYDKKIEFGSIWNFKYPIDGTNEFIEVATTRPETMLGDTGVAVHPKDERYQHLLGKNVKHPFVDRLLPIFADDTVEKDFGTGAVKITPAHDFNDFRRGKDHKLEFINILNDNGTMNSNAGPLFEGQRRFDARYTVIAELEKLGLYVGKQSNPMKIPLCSKSKDIIEPILKPQWWMHMEPLAKPALDVVKDGSIKIQPQTAENMYVRWMENVDDWCLSRQLWWGHQIPAYYAKTKDSPYDADYEHWFCAETEELAREKAKAKFGDREFVLERDPDCLDTWFSSGLWPFSTLGWPEKTHDFEKLFPTSVLETGWDILFFWVARMIFFSLKMTGKIPFSEVYCHSLIRDTDGRKMSKSLGNVIDPVDIMDGITLEELNAKLLQGNLAPKEVERAMQWQKKAFVDGIDECGADALRFSLINYTTGGGDINFDVKVMRGYRNFCNKIYQATKYVLGNLPADFTPKAKGGMTGKESLPERWILHKMTIAAREVNDNLAKREFSDATQALHRYWLYELCDVYIENSKSIIRDGTPEERESAIDTLYTALDEALRMMHPFMPFLTEELWQRLPRRPGDSTKSIVIADYPQYDASLDDAESERAYELILGCSKGVRSLIQEHGVKEDGKAFVRPLSDEAYRTASAEAASIKTLAGKNCSALNVLKPGEEVPKGAAVYPVSAAAGVYLLLGQNVDTNKEIKKIQPKLQKAADAVKEQEKTLGALSDKVNPDVRRAEEGKLKDYLSEQQLLQESLEQLHVLSLEE